MRVRRATWPTRCAGSPRRSATRWDDLRTAVEQRSLRSGAHGGRAFTHRVWELRLHRRRTALAAQRGALARADRQARDRGRGYAASDSIADSATAAHRDRRPAVRAHRDRDRGGGLVGRLGRDREGARGEAGRSRGDRRRWPVHGRRGRSRDAGGARLVGRGMGPRRRRRVRRRHRRDPSVTFDRAGTYVIGLESGDDGLVRGRPRG